MRSAALLLPILALCAVAGSTSCKRHEPAPTAPARPVTGWTAEDSAWASQTVAEALSNDAWVNRFREGNGRAPVVEITAFADRSGDHVPTDLLTEAMAKALAFNDRVLTASEGQVADVRLSGAIGLRDGQADGAAARFFTVDARVVDSKTGDPLWVTGLQHRRTEPVAAGPTTAAAATR